MPKVTMTFNLPEEEPELALCRNASKLASIIYEFTTLCRQKTKYATGDEKPPSWDDVSTEWWQIMGEEKYDPYTD
jgi:hypothetical protein